MVESLVPKIRSAPGWGIGGPGSSGCPTVTMEGKALPNINSRGRQTSHFGHYHCSNTVYSICKYPTQEDNKKKLIKNKKKHYHLDFWCLCRTFNHKGNLNVKSSHRFYRFICSLRKKNAVCMLTRTHICRLRDTYIVLQCLHSCNMAQRCFF